MNRDLDANKGKNIETANSSHTLGSPLTDLEHATFPDLKFERENRSLGRFESIGNLRRALDTLNQRYLQLGISAAAYSSDTKLNRFNPQLKHLIEIRDLCAPLISVQAPLRTRLAFIKVVDQALLSLGEPADQSSTRSDLTSLIEPIKDLRNCALITFQIWNEWFRSASPTELPSIKEDIPGIGEITIKTSRVLSDERSVRLVKLVPSLIGWGKDIEHQLNAKRQLEGLFQGQNSSRYYQLGSTLLRYIALQGGESQYWAVEKLIKFENQNRERYVPQILTALLLDPSLGDPVRELACQYLAKHHGTDLLQRLKPHLFDNRTLTSIPALRPIFWGLFSLLDSKEVGTKDGIKERDAPAKIAALLLRHLVWQNSYTQALCLEAISIQKFSPENSHPNHLILAKSLIQERALNILEFPDKQEGICMNDSLERRLVDSLSSLHDADFLVDLSGIGTNSQFNNLLQERIRNIRGGFSWSIRTWHRIKAWLSTSML